MSTRWFEDGNYYVAVRTGQPQDAVQIGIGLKSSEAIEDLQDTPIQSVGRDSGVAGALRWARNQGWIDDSDLEEIEDPMDDEEEEEEPEEDAFSDEQMAEGYVLSDAKRRSGYDVTHEHKHFGYYKYREDAFEAIDQAMKREKFYPNIYYVNDHGNVDLLDSDGKVIESRV
jgi:hypothetical protein